MERYLNTFLDAITGTLNWTVDLILLQTGNWYNNYFYALILFSLVVWLLEYLFPWRKDQSLIRKDFWLDGFYMFFNFFIFSIAISGFFSLLELGFSDLGITTKSLALLDVSGWSTPLALLVFFVLNDFFQWFTHIMLHRFEWLWQFHKVHHSVEEMGFAAHLRYHWMENIFYKPLKVLAVMLIGGFEPSQAFIVHFFSILIGHLNHANVRITWGPLKYVFNNSVMHLYHHAKHLPAERRKGVNFAISLSIWDYLFGTNYIPQDQDGSYELGFEGVENFPNTFAGQFVHGIIPKQKQATPNQTE